MIMFVMTGPSLSGKTSTAKLLDSTLREMGYDTYPIIGKTREVATLETYRWLNTSSKLNEDERPFAIVDGGYLNVLDRDDMFNVIQDYYKSSGEEGTVKVIAIHHLKSRKMIFAANEANDYKYPEKRLRSLLNLEQQPIRAEGFDMIYRINHKTDINHMLLAVANVIGDELAGLTTPPVVEVDPASVTTSSTSVEPIRETDDTLEPSTESSEINIEVED